MNFYKQEITRLPLLLVSADEGPGRPPTSRVRVSRLKSRFGERKMIQHWPRVLGLQPRRNDRDAHFDCRVGATVTTFESGAFYGSPSLQSARVVSGSGQIPTRLLRILFSP